MERLFFVLASISGGLAVVLGAFGAHTLKGRIEPELLTAFDTGVRYHMYHALALLAVARARLSRVRLQAAAAWLFLAGMALFSGSLYVLSLTGVRWLGGITPLGELPGGLYSSPDNLSIKAKNLSGFPKAPNLE
jgi:uncharacterized membrane protein YgdD (TMEM256/DUF423 family)